MYKTIGVIAACFLFVGCASQEEIRRDQLAEYSETCVERGYTPNTALFQQCVAYEEQMFFIRQQQMIQGFRNAAEIWQQQQIINNQQRQTYAPTRPTTCYQQGFFWHCN